MENIFEKKIQPLTLAEKISVAGLPKKLHLRVQKFRKGISRNTMYNALQDERPDAPPLRRLIRSEAEKLLKENEQETLSDESLLLALGLPITADLQMVIGV